MVEPHEGISRRRVLLGTAWTAPVIVMAVAVPRAAASEGDTIVSGDVLTFNNVTISNGTNGEVEANFGFQFQWTAGYPAGLVATAYYQVTATGPSTYQSPIQTVQMTNGSSVGPLSITLTGVPVGTYTVTTRVWGQAYDPETDITYVANPIQDVQQFDVVS